MFDSVTDWFFPAGMRWRHNDVLQVSWPMGIWNFIMTSQYAIKINTNIFGVYTLNINKLLSACWVDSPQLTKLFQHFMQSLTHF